MSIVYLVSWSSSRENACALHQWQTFVSARWALWASTSSFCTFIFQSSRRQRVKWHWKVDSSEKLDTKRERRWKGDFQYFALTHSPPGHSHLFLFLTYYRRQWRCWDDPFSCWFIFGLTWRRACHGVKNYFSQEIISPLLLLTLVLCTGELQSTGHTQAQIQTQMQIQRHTQSHGVKNYRR